MLIWIPVVALVLAAALCLYYGFFIEVRRLKKEEIILQIPALPESWDGRRILFISDFHLGSGMPPQRFCTFMARLRKERPDLLLCGGDLWEKAGASRWEADRELWFSEFSRLNPPLGKFSVFGNHDLESAAARMRCQELADAASLRFLRNEGIMLEGLYLAGLDDALRGRPELGKALLNKTDPEAFELLLFHEPDAAAALPPAAVSRLCLSGHSHDGQIKPFGFQLYLEKMGWRYPRGLYELRPKQWLYTSSGLGTVRIHARFAAPPSYLLLQLRRPEGTPSA